MTAVLASAGLAVTQVGPGFAGRVERIDLCGPLTAEQVAAIDRGMDRYAVLVFPGQVFDDESQFRFGQRFGKVEGTATAVDRERLRLANPQMNDISNLGLDGKVLP